SRSGSEDGALSLDDGQRADRVDGRLPRRRIVPQPRAERDHVADLRNGRRARARGRSRARGAECRRGACRRAAGVPRRSGVSTGEAWRMTSHRAHVLQIALSLTPGGTERLVVEICRRIAPEFRATVCCLDEDGAWATDLKNDGVDVIALRREPGFRPSVGRRIARIAAEGGIRLANCHQYSPFVYGRIAAWWMPELKLVYTEHGRLSDAPPSWKRRMVNPLLSRFDGTAVAVSHELRDYM